MKMFVDFLCDLIIWELPHILSIFSGFYQRIFKIFDAMERGKGVLQTKFTFYILSSCASPRSLPFSFFHQM